MSFLLALHAAHTDPTCGCVCSRGCGRWSLEKGDCNGEYTYASREPVGEGYGSDTIDQDDYVHGLEDGRYYWDVDAWSGKCQWTLTLTPLE